MHFFTILNSFEEITTLTTPNHFDNVFASWPCKICTFLEPGRFRQQEARYLYKKKEKNGGPRGPTAVGRTVVLGGETEEQGRGELKAFPTPI